MMVFKSVVLVRITILVQGNYVGVGADGVADIGNAEDGDGIHLYGGASSNIIGGGTTNLRNVVSANGNTGIHVQGEELMETSFRATTSGSAPTD